MISCKHLITFTREDLAPIVVDTMSQAKSSWLLSYSSLADKALRFETNKGTVEVWLDRRDLSTVSVLEGKILPIEYRDYVDHL